MTIKDSPSLIAEAKMVEEPSWNHGQVEFEEGGGI